ncbi:hypothetical protein ACFL27_16590, partial [candidate division CSSED10-310 bacterium]
MAILYHSAMKILIQGPQSERTALIIDIMKEYGTDVVACAFPLTSRNSIRDVPCYVSVEEAYEKHDPFDASIIVCDAQSVKSLAVEAIYSKIELIIIVPNGVPVYDCLALVQEAAENNVRVLGPGSKGILNPGIGLLGLLPLNTAFPSLNDFQTGSLAIVTRSGSFGLSLAYTLKQKG